MFQLFSKLLQSKQHMQLLPCSTQHVAPHPAQHGEGTVQGSGLPGTGPRSTASRKLDTTASSLHSPAGSLDSTCVVGHSARGRLAALAAVRELGQESRSVMARTPPRPGVQHPQAPLTLAGPHPRLA